MHDPLKDKIKTLPNKPGVYQYFDKSGKIIYVGKAKNLKKRVASYFTKNHDSGKTQILVKRIHEIKYIVVDTEVDALLLENNLIKKYQPKYNIQLKDDKTYPWIVVKNEHFPRVFKTRRVIKDGSTYYGPYASVKMLYTLLDLIREVYPLRTCNLNLSPEAIAKKNYKVCLEYHIGNCKGPCVGHQTEEDYDAYLTDIKNILKGNVTSVIKALKNWMKDLAAEMRYEEAQEVKEKLRLLEGYYAKSAVVSPTIHNVDVITLVEDDKYAFVNYLKLNNGAIIHGHTVEVKKKLDESPEEILPLVLIEMRERFGNEGKEVITEVDISDEVDHLNITVPQRGDKKSLLDLSKRNAKFYMLEKHKQEKLVNPDRHVERIMETMQKDLKMKEWPTHIECFDNSNFQGTNAVAACVVFKNGKPSKKDYRHFNIKTVTGPDDFASMEEVVYRRYSRLIREDQPIPQLVVIDGGKGQLSSAMKSFEKLGLKGEITVIGIAKKLEEIYFPGDSIPIYIDKRSETLKIIQHLRNEAHRFGITHHRNKRSKAALGTELTNIEGIGDRTAEMLIQEFKSVKRVKESTLDEIEKIIGRKKAELLVNYFKQNNLE
ncbi:excinuclease ABC subunit UvrC [Paracrocinitomix mangrovi]|uniref:excinuclease ABC subunit UvrC n=1 Tax=Paracrocinitomix mangrovi TaxID=2862509 RepID=UPI001C8D30DD|nr:excinuclease ABC subunit UvrC [Paracrocinitomix mangrovi]UKN00798.1 excinuclease ABC subunit UvrC [Paracrocinitomix mangrovi]